MRRLDRLARSKKGGLAVVWGRRRLGKTRLLLEWAAKHEGVYYVADESSAAVQLIDAREVIDAFKIF